MKKNYFILVLVISLFASCQSKKKYQYIETVYINSISNGFVISDDKPQIIEAVSDSDAYDQSYTEFCISVKTSKDFITKNGFFNKGPIKFRLIDGKGTDITNNLFLVRKNRLEDRIQNVVLGDNDISKYNVNNKGNELREQYWTDQTQKIEEEKKNASINSLKSEIESLKNIDFNLYRGSYEDINSELSLFKRLGDLVSIYEYSDNNELEMLCGKLKKMLVSSQVSEFINIRKEYGRIAKEKLWEHDIKVTFSGSRNTIINFTGGIFAANKNKKDFNDEIYDVLKKYRFKEVRYRWYEGSDEYTYWNVYDGSDSDPVTE